MLAPDQRSLLLDAIRPPDGYQFDSGLATTYTLNLMTLLVAPLSLALYELSEAEGALKDPIVLMEALERVAGKLTVFCQAGAIAIPPEHNHLFAHLEKSIVEIEAPGGGVFHPKLWLLRFVADELPVHYRLLNLTRNLTFDRSWDLMVQIEGDLQDRVYGYSLTKPLGDFIQALPKLASRQVHPRIRQSVDLLQDEVRKVDFQVPEPFFEDSLSFHPLGHRNQRGIPVDFQPGRKLVISPFLTAGFLSQVIQEDQRSVLISAGFSMDQVGPAVVDRFEQAFVLDDAGIEEAADEGEPVIDERDPAGLHAKLMVVEEGWDAQWYLGSANATDAAYRGSNVEFMVGMKGRKSKVGIDKILGSEDDTNALRAMLVPYEPDVREVEDSDQRKAEIQCQTIQKALVAGKLKGTIREAGSSEDYDLSVTCGTSLDLPDLGQGLTLKCWPVSLPEARAQPLDLLGGDGKFAFQGLSMLALTSFIAFEATAHVGEALHKLRFVFNVPLSGMPDERGDRILREILSDRDRFLRYLRLLLAEDERVFLEAMGTDSAGENGWWRGFGGAELPLLEALIRALSRSPDKIDRVDALIQRLRSAGGDHDVLPPGFNEVWSAIHEAREGLG